MEEFNRKKVYDRVMNSIEWKAVRDVFVVDKKCKMCGSMKEIEAHHIRYVEGVKGYLDTDNLVPLCKTCHYVVHSMELEIKLGWSRQKYASLRNLSFRLNLIGRAYEKMHKTDMKVPTREYLTRLINCIPEDSANIELNVTRERDGQTTPRKAADALFGEMENCPVLDSDDGQDTGIGVW